MVHTACIGIPTISYRTEYKCENDKSANMVEQSLDV